MARTKKEQLVIDANKASRLEALRNQPGWRDFEEIVQTAYDDATNDLLEKENPEARGAIKAITDIMQSISHDIKFGKVARERYKQKYLGGNENP